LVEAVEPCDAGHVDFHSLAIDGNQSGKPVPAK
jgi:hypothetical protein